MDVESADEFQTVLPESYTGMPVNLVTAFADGSIAYNLMASLFKDSTGNQILDGTKSLTSEKKMSFIPTRDLPRTVNPASGFLVAANNQATVGSRPVPGTARSNQLGMRLGSLTRGNYHKLGVEDMERVLMGDVTDSFALALLKGRVKLTSIFSSQVNAFRPEE